VSAVQCFFLVISLSSLYPALHCTVLCTTGHEWELQPDGGISHHQGHRHGRHTVLRAGSLHQVVVQLQPKQSPQQLWPMTSNSFFVFHDSISHSVLRTSLLHSRSHLLYRFINILSMKASQVIYFLCINLLYVPSIPSSMRSPSPPPRADIVLITGDHR
jgi:hypothetical protein